MPTLADALAALKALDNGADLASAVTAEVEAQKQKVFEVIGEKRNVTNKAQTLETALLAIAKAAGIQETDLESILTNAEPKIRAIATEATTLKTEAETLKTQLSEASGKLTTFERRNKLTEIATTAGANAAVLERLFGDRFDDLKLEGEGADRVVKLGDKPLKEAIAADPGLAPFEGALFAAASPSPSPTPAPAPKLPGGNPNGSESKPDVVGAHIERNYGGHRALFGAKK